jgi:hypothetical protein
VSDIDTVVVDSLKARLTLNGRLEKRTSHFVVQGQEPTSRGAQRGALCRPSRRDRGDRVFEEEAQHLPSGVWSSRIGVGAGRAAS